VNLSKSEQEYGRTNRRLKYIHL